VLWSLFFCACCRRRRGRYRRHWNGYGPLTAGGRRRRSGSSTRRPRHERAARSESRAPYCRRAGGGVVGVDTGRRPSWPPGVMMTPRRYSNGNTVHVLQHLNFTMSTKWFEFATCCEAALQGRHQQLAACSCGRRPSLTATAQRAVHGGLVSRAERSDSAAGRVVPHLAGTRRADASTRLPFRRRPVVAAAARRTGSRHPASWPHRPTTAGRSERRCFVRFPLPPLLSTRVEGLAASCCPSTGRRRPRPPVLAGPPPPPTRTFHRCVVGRMYLRRRRR